MTAKPTTTQRSKSIQRMKRAESRNARNQIRQEQLSPYDVVDEKSDDAENELKLLAYELLAVCLGTFADFGLDLSRLPRIDPESLASHRFVPTAQRLFQDIRQLSELVNQWSEDTRYVDASGRPKLLLIDGSSPSFSSLVSKYFGLRPVEEILDLGCRTKVLERVGADKVAQLSACVVLTGLPTLILAHAVYSVRAFLATARHNALAITDCVLPDRKAATALHVEDFPDFVAAMRQPTANLIEIGNRWLTARAASKPSGHKPNAVVGIHAYIFQDSLDEGPPP